MDSKPTRGRPATGTQRKAVTVSLQPDEQALLAEVTARYNITQSEMFRFILRHSWLLGVPAVELDRLRRKQAGDD